jgi:hypothetical protein
MDDQPVLRGVDGRHAGVMALVVQAVRRDDTMQVLQRRQAHRGLAGRIGRAAGSLAPDNGGLEARRLAVRRPHHLGAGLLLPFGDGGRKVCGRAFGVSRRRSEGHPGHQARRARQSFAPGCGLRRESSAAVFHARSAQCRNIYFYSIFIIIILKNAWAQEDSRQLANREAMMD